MRAGSCVQMVQDIEALDDRQTSHSFSGNFPTGRPSGATVPLKGTAGSASAGLPPPASLEAQALSSRISGTAGHLIADRYARFRHFIVSSMLLQLHP